MLRGQISAESAPVIGIDYRLLVDVSRSYNWFQWAIPRLLLEAGFEDAMRKLLPIYPGVVSWLENLVYRQGRQPLAIALEVPLLRGGLDLVLGELVSQIEHFDTITEFREWVRVYNRMAVLYTGDPLLLAMDGQDLAIRSSSWRG